MNHLKAININGPKIRISSNLLKNLYTSQLEGTGYKILNWHFKILYLKFIFRQSGPKLKLSSEISTELHENLCTDQYERAKHEPKVNIFIVLCKKYINLETLVPN